jgi:hypothetical protein
MYWAQSILHLLYIKILPVGKDLIAKVFKNGSFVKLMLDSEVMRHLILGFKSQSSLGLVEISMEIFELFLFSSESLFFSDFLTFLALGYACLLVRVFEVFLYLFWLPASDVFRNLMPLVAISLP